MFLEDSSVLDLFDGDLWTVDNGTVKYWKLDIDENGVAIFSECWKDGKTVAFKKYADNLNAAGPDAEGTTLDGNRLVYLDVERDNSAKGNNYNIILQVDSNIDLSRIVASKERDLTDLIDNAEKTEVLKTIKLAQT